LRIAQPEAAATRNFKRAILSMRQTLYRTTVHVKPTIDQQLRRMGPRLGRILKKLVTIEG